MQRQGTIHKSKREKDPENLILLKRGFNEDNSKKQQPKKNFFAKKNFSRSNVWLKNDTHFLLFAVSYTLRQQVSIYSD